MAVIKRAWTKWRLLPKLDCWQATSSVKNKKAQNVSLPSVMNFLSSCPLKPELHTKCLSGLNCALTWTAQPSSSSNNFFISSRPCSKEEKKHKDTEYYDYSQSTESMSAWETKTKQDGIWNYIFLSCLTICSIIFCGLRSSKNTQRLMNKPYW